MSFKHKLYVGIDSHSKIHKVALIPVETMQNSIKEFSRSALLDVGNNLDDFENLDRSIKSYTPITREVIIGIDTAGIYSLPLTYYLQKQGYAVHYIEQKSSKSSRGIFFDIDNKSDVIDAIRVAQFLYMKDLAGSLFKATTIRTPDLTSDAFFLHTMVLHRQQYTKLVVQSTNKLHAILTGIFPEAEKKYFSKLITILPHYPTPQDITRSLTINKVEGVGKVTAEAISKLAKKTVGIPADNYKDLILNLCQQLEQAREWKKEITSMIEVEVDKHPYGAILLSFPQLGYIASATIIGAIGDINRWSTDKKLKKAFGVYSSFRESGKSLIIHKKGRSGSRLCKSTLFQVVMRCIKDSTPENDFKDYYHWKVSKGKPKISAIVATMGKLTEIIYHCLKVCEFYSYQGIYKRERSRYRRSKL